MNKKKVVHVINALETGGVEVGILNIIKSNPKNYKVITTRRSDKDFLALFTKDELANVYLSSNIISSLFFIFKENPDIIISSLWRGHMASLIFSVLTFFRIKRVHFSHSARYAHFMDEIITKISTLFSSSIFCDSKNTFEWIVDEFPLLKGKCEVVPMFISFHRLDKIHFTNKMKFVFMGRICKEKNLPMAIEFISYLYDKGMNVEFDIFGRDDGEYEKIKGIIDKYNIGHVVKFRGVISPLESEIVMRNYDFYLQTSIVEGMAISVYQSVSHGLLPVVTPVGEISSYCIHKVNAFFLNKEDLNLSAKEFLDSYLAKNFMQSYKLGFIDSQHTPFVESFFHKLESVR
jgi:glycosyltransferase involved in cell wall biosynthesis